MDKVFSTYQVAQICKVHHTTVIHWVKEGKLNAYTTPGKHRRIKKTDLLMFMEGYGIPIPEEFHKSMKSVLVVDDDEEALLELKDALQNQGFSLAFASDGFDVGRMIYRQKPDLILLDFKMPGMDGFQVCQTLSEDKETAQIPIFAVTALRSEEDKKRIAACGVNEYVSKPIDVKKLLLLIKKTLGITLNPEA